MKEKDIVEYESLEDALNWCIRGGNKGTKEVAARLWPSDEAAHNRLMEALNPNKKQKLSLNEIIFIMNYCNRFDPLYYMADKTLHDRPVKKCIEAEEREMGERFETLMNGLTKDYQRFNRLREEREQIEKIRSGNISILDLEKKRG